MELAQSKKQKGVKRVVGWSRRFVLQVLCIFLIVTIVQVVVLRFFDPPFTARMAWSWLQSKLASKQHKKPKYQWRQLDEISPYLRKAVLAGEDQRFLSHHGFDFTELSEASKDFLTDKRLRGASTITMQVARTVFLWPCRSWLRKIAEAYYTVLIEIVWSKERIFEIYINTVHWGKGIMGAEAASKKYFSTSSFSLTPYQAALLAAILPKPNTWSPINPSRHVRERQKRIMKEMVKMPLL